PARIEQALRQGDVYMHCMYGVNRTGFATARFARATGEALSHSGLGARDWRQGDAFQARLDHRRVVARPRVKAPQLPRAAAPRPAPDGAAVKALCAGAAWAMWAASLPLAR